MSNVAKGTFDVDLTPAASEFDGAVSRFEWTKRFHGDLDATSRGVMLSSGDPQAGTAGYVAIERVTGTLGGRDGAFAFQQFATMRAGSQVLHYEVVPGSGEGALSGLYGTLTLRVDEDATHHYELEYEV